MNFTQQRHMSVTDEEGDLLYALIRMLKPIHCFETGAGSGISAYRIGQALALNGEGSLNTCELDDERIAETTERCKGLPVTIHKIEGINLLSNQEVIDFAFIDSGEPAVRLQELKLLEGTSKVPSNGVVVVHDVLNPIEDYDYSILCKNFGLVGWNKLIFQSLVGIAIYQKV